MIVVLIQLLIFSVYIAYILYKYGVLSSISDSYYSLPESRRYLFTFFIWGVGAPILALTDYSGLFFAAGAFLFFVGAATQFRSDDGFTPQVHSIGATGGIVAALFALVSLNIYYPLIIASIASILIKKLKVPNSTWWIEVACFACIEIGLIDFFWC